MRSAWVEKEIIMAKLRKKRIVPLVEVHKIPWNLRDIIYIPITKDQTDFDSIIPAIFRDSFIVDDFLQPSSIELDTGKLRACLGEFMQSEFKDLKVRIRNDDFNSSMAQIAQKTIEELSAHKTEIQGPMSSEALANSLTRQIKREADFFEITLPIYWANLAELFGLFLNQLFTDYGKSLSTLRDFLGSAEKTWSYCVFILAYRLSGVIFPDYADKFGFPNIASFFRKYEKTDENEIVQHLICGEQPVETPVKLHLEGSKEGKVRNANIFFPKLSSDAWTDLQFGPREVANTIESYDWFAYCVPQILGSFLQGSAFGDGMPLHKLPYKVGLLMSDYESISAR
jgi:hypothetical protein